MLSIASCINVAEMIIKNEKILKQKILVYLFYWNKIGINHIKRVKRVTYLIFLLLEEKLVCLKQHHLLNSENTVYRIVINLTKIE